MNNNPNGIVGTDTIIGSNKYIKRILTEKTMSKNSWGNDNINNNINERLNVLENKLDDIINKLDIMSKM